MSYRRHLSNTRECENHCPRCGAEIDDIDWGITQIGDGGETFQDAVCKKCGCEFEEELTYKETTYDDDD